MIAYEIQLRYVIRDKIQSRIKFVGKKILLEKKLSKKNLSWTLSQISRVQSELSRTNRCLSSLSDTYMMQGKCWHMAVATCDSSQLLTKPSAPTKRHCSSAEAVLVGKWVAPPGFAEILKSHPPVWMRMILLKANALCTVEGSRLLQ